MMHWNYKLITVLWWWISNKAGCSHSRSTISLTADVEHPKEALEPNTGEPVRERDWMDVGLREVAVCVCMCVCRGGRVPLCWPDYSLNRMSSHNKGFIITSWRVAAVWELCTAVFSARRPKYVAQLCFWSGGSNNNKPCIRASLSLSLSGL